MIRETYKGRQLKVTKGREFGYARAAVNGVDLGHHMGDEAAALRWMKGTIDHADEAGMGAGRYGAEWYAPGTYELNEHGHVVAPGGICTCGYCEERRLQPCADIKVDGKCVCDHCMKPYLTDSTEQADEAAEEVAITVEDVQAAASETLTGRLVKVTPELTGLAGARPYLLRVTRVDVVNATSGLVHVHGDKVRLDGTPSREKRPSKAATFMPGWRERLAVAE